MSAKPVAPERVSALDQLSRLTFRVQKKATPRIELWSLLVVGIAVALFREPHAAWRGTMWAEDGRVFLQDALNRGGLQSIASPSAGYLNVAPRLIATVVVLLPLTWQGIAVNLSAALVQSAIGLLVYAAAEADIPARWPRLLILLGVAAVPVGPEVIDSIANAQWFLLAGAAVALLWTPVTRAGRTAAAVAIIAATTTSPFAGVLLLMAVIRLVIQRNARAVMLASVTGGGFALQTLAMVTAPKRATSDHVHLLLAGYIRRVLGDGVFGIARHDPTKSSTSIAAGLIVIALMAFLAIILLIQRKFEPVLAALILGILGYVFFMIPTNLGGVDTADFSGAARYYVAPVLLVLFAIAILAGNVMSSVSWRRPSGGWLGAAAAGFMVGACAYGLVTSWSPNAFRIVELPASFVSYRERTQGWSASLDRVRSKCDGPTAPDQVFVPIAPEGWHVLVPCSRVRGG